MGDSSALRGIVFPPQADNPSSRSSAKAGQTIIAAALGAASDRAGQAAASAKNWRKSYIQQFHHMSEVAIESPENSVAIARAGLAKAHELFAFAKDDGEQPLSIAMENATALLRSVEIKGAGTLSDKPFKVPLKGKNHLGEHLYRILNDWRKRHIIQPDAEKVLSQFVNNSPVARIEGDRFILLGAAAEVGPCEQLLALGATVVAIDIDKPAVWEKLIATARTSPGTLVVPVRGDLAADASDADIAAAAGANLLTEAPEILHWLRDYSDARSIGCYAYMDGANHVKIAMAMDAITSALLKDNPKMAYAFMLTPTDSFAVPASCADIAEKRGLAVSRGLGKLLAGISGDTVYASNIRKRVKDSNGVEFGLVDNLLSQQGPNYSLAKRIQRWRAIVARADGHTVSANVAPATMTRSVVSNKIFELCYEGCALFGGEAFEPATTNALMSALFLHDLQDKKSASNPDKALANPECLFMENAMHGGTWTIGYQTRSVVLPAVTYGTAASALKRK